MKNIHQAKRHKMQVEISVCAEKPRGTMQEKDGQAGAELCQAQEKPGLAKPALPVVVFHLL